MDKAAKSKSQAKRFRAQGAERTHYADDETLAYIAKLERENEDLRIGYFDLLKSNAAGLQDVYELRAEIVKHKHACVKCGDCDYWDRYE